MKYNATVQRELNCEEPIVEKMGDRIWLALLSVVMLGFEATAEYNTTGGIVSDKLNVHLVAHTHDDVGWLETVDGYYEDQVRTILDSVVSSLSNNANRKFVYVEQAFFQKWWAQQADSVKNVVKKLVNAGQLDFINGGWCMHDEATTHYIDMIEQTTLGHSFIKEEFGKVPRIGWQIDPFGHSAVQAYLLSAEMGFDGLFFARIDYQDRDQRSQNKKLEFVWQGSKTFKSQSEVFTDTFPSHYNPPSGFEYEDQNQILLQDDPSKGTVNIKERVDAFVQAAKEQSTVTLTDHIMWTMGDDFKYMDAEIWFDQMDKLIHYVNLDGRVNVLYSTPSIYLDAKHAANKTWPLKTEDLFPYADGANSYWTGYFSSRASLKGYVRQTSGFLQVARQLEFLVGRKEKGPNTYKLWDAMSVVQHHDGVSGTEQQHVADDYAKQIAAGVTEAEKVMQSAISCLTSNSSDCGTEILSSRFVQCPLLNISYCPLSEATLPPQKDLMVTAYNALGWQRDEYIRIPVNSQAVIVVDDSGKTVPSQLVLISDPVKKIRKRYVEAYLGKVPGDGATYSLVFKASVPPLGFRSYFVKPSVSRQADAAAASDMITVSLNENTTAIGFQNKYVFSSSTGQLVQIANNKSQIVSNVQQTYNWYAANADDGQSSGAYIFRPDSDKPTLVSGSERPTVIRGPLFEEYRAKISPWIYQESRVYKDEEYAEVDFMVGPIPVDDNVGKEVITRFKTNINSSKVFYTDSNGRDFLKRVRDSRPDYDYEVVQPIAGNYYPVNLGIYIKDKKNDLSVLVDRSMGASSINDGEIEIMLHRRLLNDDGRGVSEPLNEQVCIKSNCEGLTVKGRLYLSQLPAENAARWRRTQGQKIYSPLQLFFSHQDKASEAQKQRIFSMTTEYSLPDNVALITLQEIGAGNVIVRLAHLYEEGEDKEMSKLAKVDLKKMLSKWEIISCTELSLSANQPKAEMKRLKWNTEEEEGEKKVGGVRGGVIKSDDLIVELGAMEIRTLHLNVKFKSSSK